MIRLRAPDRISFLNCLRKGVLGVKIKGSGFGGITFALFKEKEMLLKNR